MRYNQLSNWRKGEQSVGTAKKIVTIFYKMATEKVEFDPYILDGNRQNYLQNNTKKLEIALKEMDSLITDNQQVVGLVR